MLKVAMKTTIIKNIEELLSLIEVGSVCVLFDTQAAVPLTAAVDFDHLLYVQITSENAHEYQVCRVPQLRVYQNGLEIYSHIGDDYNNVLLNMR